MRGNASSVTLTVGAMSQTTVSGSTENSWGRTVHSPNNYPMPFEVILYSGQSINVNNSGTEWYFVIREFSIP